MLHELTRPSSSKRKGIQIGRWNGSGKGNYSTRGLKGQWSRTGFSQQPGFEGGQTPLHMRLPKKRWFKKYFKLVNHVTPINLGTLQADDRIASGSTVSPEFLVELGYGKIGHTLKILGDWEVTKTLTIVGLAISKTAKESIEKAWGSITA